MTCRDPSFVTCKSVPVLDRFKKLAQVNYCVFKSSSITDDVSTAASLSSSLAAILIVGALHLAALL